MRSGFGVSILSLFLLAILGRPAPANAEGLIFSEQSIATAVNSSLMIDEACQPSPYALYRLTCVNNQLNITLERSPFEKLTFLDHLALFVHKHRNVATSKELISGVKFRIGVNLSHVYEQEAKLEARLRVRW